MTQEHYILIDSRLRDTSKYITPAQYVFELLSPIKNVKTIELVHAIYAKNDSNPEKYAYLCIKEIPVLRFHSVGQAYPMEDDNVFTYLPFHKKDQHTIEYEFTSKIFKACHTFEQPLPDLPQLSIAIIDKDGRLFPIQEHILCFKIDTIDTKLHIQNMNNDTLNTRSPYEVLGLVKGTFTLEMLVERFKQQANTLRNSGIYSSSDYEELKQAFRKLANTFKKDTM